MCAPLPTRADPWRAAAAGDTMQGAVAPGRVPRLAGVARLDAPLTACLRFGLDEAGTPVVDVEVQGCYGFTCQRCLQPMRDRRRDRSRVLVAGDDAEGRTLESRGETVVCARGETLELAALVEDEVLLALPLAPCHASEECAGERSSPAGHTGHGGEAPEAGRGEDGPFAALAALRDGARDE